MRFRLFRQARTVAIMTMVGALMALSSCHRAASKEEKALRAELRKALDDQAYERAADLARRHLKLKPGDSGTWDRLGRAEFGLHDLPGVKRTLDEWRQAVPHPSISLDEYTGDLAAAQNDDTSAIEAWTNAVSVDAKNIRVLEKIARFEKRRRFWIKEDAAWSSIIAVQVSAVARINRALCRR